MAGESINLLQLRKELGGAANGSSEFRGQSINLVSLRNECLREQAAYAPTQASSPVSKALGVVGDIAFFAPIVALVGAGAICGLTYAAPLVPPLQYVYNKMGIEVYKATDPKTGETFTEVRKYVEPEVESGF